MKLRASIALALLAVAAAWAVSAADLPPLTNLRPPARPATQPVPTGELAVFPEVLQVGAQPAVAGPPRERADKLQDRSRLELIRFVMGEFARAVQPLPATKNGYRHEAGKPLDVDAVRRSAAASGTAANPGDQVQITKLSFKGSEIVVDINGGAKKKRSWRERISFGMGGGGMGGPQVSSTKTGADPGPSGFQGIGSTLILDYGRPIPDITPDELKQHLGGFLDFSKQRSAATHWIETLPPEFQKAIQEKRAVVGMDAEMVVAAMGKPERKVRERDLDGLETEDWIYGHPPAQTIFVKFAGEKVIAVREYPR
jgi:hypothetical protein